MCKNLVAKGSLDEPLILFNRSNQRAVDLNAQLPAGKTSVASSIEDVVSKSDIIFTCVADDAAIQETIATAIKGNVNGKLFIDCSTVHPDTTNTLATTIEAQGAQFVACPGKQTHFDCLSLDQLNGNLYSIWRTCDGRQWSTGLRPGWSSISCTEGDAIY